MDNDELKKLLIKAANYCAKSEHAPMEVEKKLETWSKEKINNQEKQDIINRLIDEKYLSEERYANAFVSDKLRFQQKGPIRLRYDLRSKGVNDRVIDEAISNIPEDEWLEGLEKYLCRRIDKVKAVNKYEHSRKVYTLAYNRGYPSEMTSIVLQRMDQDSIISDEWE